MAKAPACSCHMCRIPPERAAEIRESVAAERGKSMFADATPTAAQCRCGVRRKPAGLAKHVVDDGLCIVHPEQPPQPWTLGASE